MRLTPLALAGPWVFMKWEKSRHSWLQKPKPIGGAPTDDFGTYDKRAQGTGDDHDHGGPDTTPTPA